MTAHGASSSIEIERKYEVLGNEPLPRIELPGAASVAEIRAQMVGSYWDTPARDLGRAGLALRSRSGGADAGWHLKERRPDGVRELQWPAAAEIPDGARAALRERIGDRAFEVVPVATVQTDRLVRRLLDASGRLLVEFADDHVLATDHDAGVSRAWREWEAELGEGAAAALLELAEPALVAAGARPSLSEAKIQRTLGQTVPAAWKRGAALPEVLACALADLADRIAASADAVRADEPDAVHRARILVRRARDLITIFSQDLGVAAEAVESTDRALRGLGRLLGAVRDAEVRAELAERLLSSEPAAPGVRRVRRLLVDAAFTERAAALAELRELTEPGQSEDAAAFPPEQVAACLRTLAYDIAGQRPAVAEPTADAIAARIDARLSKIATAAADFAGPIADSATDPASAKQLHSVRKQARCIRYAVEELGEAAGARGAAGLPLSAPLRTQLAEQAHAVQDALGEARDALTLASHLDALAAELPATESELPPEHRSAAHRSAAAELAARLAVCARGDAAAHLAEAPSAIERLQAHRLGA